MGAVHIDTERKSREYDAAYPGLHTSTGVKALLADWPKLRINAYDRGDYDAMLLLVDLEYAMVRAKLTVKQHEVLRLVYYEDLTQRMTADLLGIKQQTVSEHVEAAALNIAKIYEEWADREH